MESEAGVGLWKPRDASINQSIKPRTLSRPQDPKSRVSRLQHSGAAGVFKQLLGFHDVGVVKYVLALVDQALQTNPAFRGGKRSRVRSAEAEFRRPRRSSIWSC